MMSFPMPRQRWKVLSRSVPFLAAMLLSMGAANAQTPSFTCGTAGANQYPVGLACTTLSFNKPSGTSGNFNPGGCNASTNNSWYGWFTAIANTTTITYDPSGSNDAILHILAACGGAVLGCADNAGNGGAETVTIATVPGTNYFVRVQRKASNSGMNGTLCIHSTPSCIYRLNLLDSNGNGWGNSNRSSVTVYINGVLLGTYYLTGSSAGYDIPVFGPGTIIRLVYDNSGPNQNQNRYNLTSPCPSTALFSAGPSPAAGTAFNQPVSCPATPPQDCQGGTTVCSNQNITSNSTSAGCTQDLGSANRGCLSSNEHQGSWYYFSPSVAGTLGFTITPQNATDDYDFALWGPFDNARCPTGDPIRCSYFDGNYYSSTTTGMGNGANDTSEGPYRPPISGGLSSNNGWVQTLDVIATKVYVLYIDNYSATGQAFNLSWNLSNGASLDCSTLPVELISLEATTRNTAIDVTWATATEHNSAYFDVERSPDNETFTSIGTVAAAGDAQYRNDYILTDEHPYQGANYYRLKQVDFNGQFERTHTVVAFVGGAGARPVIFPNPATDRLNVAFVSPLEGSALIYVQDALGRIVSESSLVVLRGEQTAMLPTERLAVGWYNLSIAMPDGSILPGGRFLKK